MSWTYTANPAGVPRDAFRLYIGDTDKDDPIFQDGEADWFVTQAASPLAGAIEACTALMARSARLVSESVGEERIEYGQLLKNYQALMDSLQARLVIDMKVMPFAGGISRADVQSQRCDTDRVRPHFGNGKHPPWLSGSNAEPDISDDGSYFPPNLEGR